MPSLKDCKKYSLQQTKLFSSSIESIKNAQTFTSSADCRSTVQTANLQENELVGAYGRPKHNKHRGKEKVHKKTFEKSASDVFEILSGTSPHSSYEKCHRLDVDAGFDATQQITEIVKCQESRPASANRNDKADPAFLKSCKASNKKTCINQTFPTHTEEVQQKLFSCEPGRKMTEAVECQESRHDSANKINNADIMLLRSCKASDKKASVNQKAMQNVPRHSDSEGVHHKLFSCEPARQRSSMLETGDVRGTSTYSRGKQMPNRTFKSKRFPQKDFDCYQSVNDSGWCDPVLPVFSDEHQAHLTLSPSDANADVAHNFQKSGGTNHLPRNSVVMAIGSNPPVCQSHSLDAYSEVPQEYNSCNTFSSKQKKSFHKYKISGQAYKADFHRSQHGCAQKGVDCQKFNKRDRDSPAEVSSSGEVLLPLLHSKSCESGKKESNVYKQRVKKGEMSMSVVGSRHGGLPTYGSHPNQMPYGETASSSKSAHLQQTNPEGSNQGVKSSSRTTKGSSKYGCEREVTGTQCVSRAERSNSVTCDNIKKGQTNCAASKSTDYKYSGMCSKNGLGRSQMKHGKYGGERSWGDASGEGNVYCKKGKKHTDFASSNGVLQNSLPNSEILMQPTEEDWGNCSDPDIKSHILELSTLKLGAAELDSINSRDSVQNDCGAAELDSINIRDSVQNDCGDVSTDSGLTKNISHTSVVCVSGEDKRLSIGTVDPYMPPRPASPHAVDVVEHPSNYSYMDDLVNPICTNLELNVAGEPLVPYDVDSVLSHSQFQFSKTFSDGKMVGVSDEKSSFGFCDEQYVVSEKAKHQIDPDESKEPAWKRQKSGIRSAESPFMASNVGNLNFSKGFSFESTSASQDTSAQLPFHTISNHTDNCHITSGDLPSIGNRHLQFRHRNPVKQPSWRGAMSFAESRSTLASTVSSVAPQPLFHRGDSPNRYKWVPIESAGLMANPSPQISLVYYREHETQMPSIISVSQSDNRSSSAEQSYNQTYVNAHETEGRMGYGINMPSSVERAKSLPAFVNISNATLLTPQMKRADLSSNTQLVGELELQSSHLNVTAVYGDYQRISEHTPAKDPPSASSDKQCSAWHSASSECSSPAESIGCGSAGNVSGLLPDQWQLSFKPDANVESSSSNPASNLLNVTFPVPNRKTRRLQSGISTKSGFFDTDSSVEPRSKPRPSSVTHEIQPVAYSAPKKRLDYNNDCKHQQGALVRNSAFAQKEIPDSWEDRSDYEVPDCCDDELEVSTDVKRDTSDWFIPSDALFQAAKGDVGKEVRVGLWRPNFRSSPWNDKNEAKSDSAVFIQQSSPATEDVMDNWKQVFKNRYSSITVPFIDSHCHIDFMYKRCGYAGSFERFRALRSELFLQSFAGCVTVFCKPDTWIFESEGSLFKSVLKEDKVWGAVGCHPKHAVIYNDFFEQKLRAMLKHDKIVALGEIGLDYSGSFYQHHECQKEVLRRQVAIALELNLPLVIHSRDSEQDMVTELEKLVPRNYRIHRHCFTGSWLEAELWLTKFPGSYLGVTPLVTQSGYRTSAVRDMVRNIPLDKLLLETDAPYFMPKQIPASALCQDGSNPAFAITVAETVAEIRGISIEEVLQACYQNTKAMYGIRD